MNNDDIKQKAENADSPVKYDKDGNIINFGGWESENTKLKHNLSWTPEQILNWLEEVNSFNKNIRESTNVLRRDYKKT